MTSCIEAKLPPRASESPEDEFVRRVGEFAGSLAEELGISEPAALRAAFARAAVSGAVRHPSHVQHSKDSVESAFRLCFVHKCGFLGCANDECELCRNNPNKVCPRGVDFDEIFACKQTLKSRCGAGVSVQLVCGNTDAPVDMPDVEIQLSIVCGESASDVKELLASDVGEPLLAARLPCAHDGSGRLLLPLEFGSAALPDVYGTDKNETFKCGGEKYSTFRLQAVAVRRDPLGRTVRLDGVAAVLSSAFCVKTQRALNDYRKPEYPHSTDQLTKLRYIGKETAEKLQVLRKHIPNLPDQLASVKTVDDLRQLLAYTDQNREAENQLQELSGMKGRHEHKWKHLRAVLDRTVYDDSRFRVWYADAHGSAGLMFKATKGQVCFGKPAGLPRRSTQDGAPCVQLLPAPDADELHRLQAAAEAAWHRAGHPGWSIVREPVYQLSTRVGFAAVSGPASTVPIDPPAGKLAGLPESPLASLPHLVQQHAASGTGCIKPTWGIGPVTAAPLPAEASGASASAAQRARDAPPSAQAAADVKLQRDAATAAPNPHKMHATWALSECPQSGTAENVLRQASNLSKGGVRGIPSLDAGSTQASMDATIRALVRVSSDSSAEPPPSSCAANAGMGAALAGLKRPCPTPEAAPSAFKKYPIRPQPRTMVGVRPDLPAHGAPLAPTSPLPAADAPPARGGGVGEARHQPCARKALDHTHPAALLAPPVGALSDCGQVSAKWQDVMSRDLLLQALLRAICAPADANIPLS